MRIFVLGAGNWGTNLAVLFAAKNTVCLWTADENESQTINAAKAAGKAWHGVLIPDNMSVEPKYSRPLNKEDLIILAIPSRKMDEVAAELAALPIAPGMVLNVSKGLKHSSLHTSGYIVQKHLTGVRYATLSGPTIAAELAAGLPAKAVLASTDVSLLLHLNETLANPLLGFEFSRDVEGVELCGALKGLIAMAVGIADGLGLQTNVIGLIMTYGLHEFRTVLRFLGKPASTVYGIAGMGDLITTCLSHDSRNRTFGKLLASGCSTREALDKVGMVVEGVSMARTVTDLGKFNLHIPLITFVSQVIFEQVPDIRAGLLSVLNDVQPYQDWE